ncbi:hypothetical protein KSB_45600 [Ktedonobacter robiniae]|uniref:Uncharacterized protein n=1 Tax=Ktedonobacter robiniae TaxID=2778365 RepID=A0ABQ3UTW2_9CHLR|nr:hypothetical protein KSB_45600 [Ktedonobacter robiniae]
MEVQTHVPYVLETFRYKSPISKGKASGADIECAVSVMSQEIVYGPVERRLLLIKQQGARGVR